MGVGIHQSHPSSRPAQGGGSPLGNAPEVISGAFFCVVKRFVNSFPIMAKFTCSFAQFYLRDHLRP